MLAAMSSKFVPMLTMPFAKWLDVGLNLSSRFCKEFVYGLVSYCYCSDLTIHAFAGRSHFKITPVLVGNASYMAHFVGTVVMN